MIHRITRTFLFLCFLIVGNRADAQQHIFDTIARRIVNDMQSKENVVRLAKAIPATLASLQPNGTWADINYQDNAMAVWSPAQHLSRIQDFALVYSNNNAGYWHNKALYIAIVKALRAWNIADPHCKNWWYNEISCPQTLGQIILLMQSARPLPVGLKDSLLKKMDRGNMYKQTGANKLDVALHNLYSAVLTHDTMLMDSAVSQCFQPICLTTAPEGVQYDYSYLQHGPQLQIASYGTVFLTGEYKVASYVSGTPWQLPKAKNVLLANFFNNVFLKSIRYKYVDFSVMGRGFSRRDSGNAGALSVLRTNIGLLKKTDPDGAHNFADYDAAVLRASGKVPPSYRVKQTHTQFWIGDYTQHVSPDYLFTVRANSTRTKRTESGNGENLYGRCMSDGATNIQRSGSEYFNIFPVWDYNKIPGVTCRSYQTEKPMTTFWGELGTTNFTGGVSDGLYGASTYSLGYDGVKAKKAWFFFGKQIVCLGAGIQSASPEDITTTVNQCWSHGNVMVNKPKQSYWQDSIGYYFQPGAAVSYTNGVQKGTWNRINNSQSKDTIRGKVFKLWINHGAHPQNAAYSYIVVPGISAGEFAKESPFERLKVISNTNILQAVESTELHMLQVVFYQAGALHAGKLTINASEPCVVMLKNTDKANPRLFVADPSHKLKTLMVQVNNSKVMCLLPQNQYAGSTFSSIVK